MNLVWDNIHEELLPFIASRVKPDLYVELGVYDGNNLRRVAKYCTRAIGVDIVTPANIQGFEFYDMSTTSFASYAKGMKLEIDMMFIDADHKHESSLRDFDDYFDLVVDGGLIFLHDTHPIDESFLDPGYCADCYKTAWYIRNNYMLKCEIVTLPFHPGLSIVRKSSRQLLWKKD